MVQKFEPLSENSSTLVSQAGYEPGYHYLEQKFMELARSRKCHFSNQHKNKKGRQLLFILMSSYSILYNVYT